jgi:hypothetical protein
MKKTQVYKHKRQEKSDRTCTVNMMEMSPYRQVEEHPFKCAYWIQSWNLISTPCVVNIYLSNIFLIEIGHKQNIFPPLLF